MALLAAVVVVVVVVVVAAAAAAVVVVVVVVVGLAPSEMRLRTYRFGLGNFYYSWLFYR